MPIPAVTWHVGDVILKLRTLRGLTGNDVQAMTGLNPNTLSDWETGARQPRPAKLKLLEAVLGVSVAEMYSLIPPSGHHDLLRHGVELRSIPNLAGPNENTAPPPQTRPVPTAAVDELAYQRALTAIARVEALVPFVDRIEALAEKCESLLEPLADKRIRAAFLDEEAREAKRKSAATRRRRRARDRKIS